MGPCDLIWHLFNVLLRSLPKTSREDFEAIFSELDDSGDFKVSLVESSFTL